MEPYNALLGPLVYYIDLLDLCLIRFIDKHGQCDCRIPRVRGI